METTQSKTRTTQQVANRLVELCRKGDVLQAGLELYADNIESNEPAYHPVPLAKGKKAVGEKGKQFAETIEQRHGGAFSDPVVGANHFSVAIQLDATIKGQGRSLLNEIAVYEVKDGQIVREQFYY